MRRGAREVRPRTSAGGPSAAGRARRGERSQGDSRPPAPPRHAAQRRIETALFLTFFVSYSYFNQGGGWNQNARFDQVRAIVEAGTLSMNGYLDYQPVRLADGRVDLVRQAQPSKRLNTGDYAFTPQQGRYYPNKPPGTTFLALPGYWAAYHVERLFGINPDSLWPLMMNLFITTAFSVGVVGALTGVLFLRLSQCLFPDLPIQAHLASALTLGLATMMLPFSTLLFDHVPVAALLMLSFYLIVRERGDAGPRTPVTWRSFAAGVCAGWAVLCNYPAALGVGLLTLYAARVYRPRARVLVFLAGGLLVACVLAWYHDTCFGGPLVNANKYQRAQFTDTKESLLFGMISYPKGEPLWRLLVSTRRGLFFTSPVLLVGLAALGAMAFGRRHRAEAVLCLAMFVVYWLFNASFNGWHGGYTFAPRYLIPALPFLALPLAPVFARSWWIAAPPALFSAAVMFLATIVTPLPPEGSDDPVWGFLVPLAFNLPHATNGEFARFKGPISAWPTSAAGMPPPDATWGSFNLGELLWPQSWFSVVPLFCCLAVGVTAIFAFARKAPRPSEYA